MTVVASPLRRADAVRDPFLLLPTVVVAGLAVGWIGIDAGTSRARITVDVALAWAFVAAALVALERVRWRRSRALLATTGLVLLAGDLLWARADQLWTLGFLLSALWLAVLVHFVLTFPGGRPWSKPARLVIVGAYAASLGGQLVGAVVDPRSRNVLAVARSQAVADGVDQAQAILGLAVGLGAVLLVAQRLWLVRGVSRRTEAPLLAAALVCAPAGIAWLAREVSTESLSTLETAARALALFLPIGVVAGIAWSGVRRADAVGLFVDLKTEGAASLRDRLAKVLGDPTLELAYRLEEGRYVDPTGEPFDLPRNPERAVTPLLVQRREIAVLVHDPALLDEHALVESVRATAGLVLENERLAAEVRSQLAEVRASRGRIVAAADGERRRIERNLHDGAQQRLVTLSVALGLASSRAGEDAAAVLSGAQDEVEAAIAELRDLARGIHPTLLRDVGLQAAVEALARRAPLPVTVQGAARGRLPGSVELAAYFVVAEALTNVVKHASARSASVRLDRTGTALRVVVSDDGVGGARVAVESGLAGLRDRLDALDGALEVESDPGRGTTVRAEIPCAS